MPTRPRPRRSLTRFIAPCATVLICSYFAFHATHGQYGTRAHLVMKSRIEKMEGRLERARQRRDHLEDRLALLQDGTVEKDMLDEQIRRNLPRARADDIVLLHAPEMN